MLRTVINFETADVAEIQKILPELEQDSELARRLKLMLEQKQTSVQIDEDEIEHLIDMLPLNAKLRPQLVDALQWLRTPSRQGKPLPGEDAAKAA
jgi:hypothetical protein